MVRNRLQSLLTLSQQLMFLMVHQKRIVVAPCVRNLINRVKFHVLYIPLILSHSSFSITRTLAYTTMAFINSIFALPNKCSAILAVKLSPEHAHCSKNHFTIALQKDIHISKNGKARVRATLFMLHMAVFEIICG